MEPAAPVPAEADRLPPRPLYHHLALTVYWLSNSLLWGGLLHLGFQSRLSDWFDEVSVGYYMGVLGAVGGLLATAAQIIVGAFSDRSLHPWGRRRPYLVAGSLLGLGSLMLLGATKSFWPFAGAFLLLQVCMNAALGPFTALLPDTINPREHGKAAGFMGVARLVGDVGGLILAARLLSAGRLHGQPPWVIREFHDQRFWLMCVLMAGFTLLTMLYTILAIREEPLRQRPAQTTWQTVIGSFVVDVRGNPDFFWLSLSRAITNLGFYMFLQILYFFLRYSLKTPDAENASMLVMLPAIGTAILASLPAGMISDRLGQRRPLVFVAQFVMAAAALIFVFAPNMTWAYIAGVPAGLAYGIFTAVEWALACNLLPQGESARYLGVWNASAVVPQVLAFPLGGAIGSRLSAYIPGLGWRVVFALTVVCCVVGALFLKHVHERRDTPASCGVDGP